ncbi:hypothetical protein PIB19_17035 [Sphingomonas sp. 7/4-4]|uniref:hypothetical protein n=1 Tax=Sphingomonas sp. 7/4-4 TaxID=3018446 RepID=UPI0022F383B6|nr:hypothetical protein [Sphingomonas sp. 7/4-4]WBY07107.1 hypothetical protein PIB19_17035 [Sphingomonas sp. 7/4-4]
MMEGFEARAETLGAAAAERAAVRLAATARETLPGVSAEAEAGRVVISGRGLGRRWLRDPALRWLGGLMR